MIPSIDTLIQLGQLLQEVRQGQQLALPECAAALRIRQVYLQALEIGDWQALPGQAYGRGYLRQYAIYLGLPETEIMEACDRVQGKLTSRLRYFDLEHTEQQPPRYLLWVCLFVGVCFMVGWFALQHLASPSLNTVYEMQPEIVERQPARPSESNPYPASVQECLKLLEPARNPCYYDWQSPDIPILAYRYW